jgi:hypothetical protein
MRKLLLLLAILVCAAWAANVKLYLQDGTFHVVREYQVLSDRVHYYSVERGDWEDIPLTLVDLKRTESEAAARKTQIDEDARSMAEEEKAAREFEREKSRIPQDPGVYWLEGKETRVMKQADSTLHTNKGQSILKALSPIPVVTGRATLELKGTAAATVFTNPEQEFYIQLSSIERYGIAKLTPKGQVRIVANVTKMPVTDEIFEEPVMVAVIKQQLDNGLYKIWPKEKLPPGEYAVIEYTEGKLNFQIWDFAIRAK